MVVELKDLLAQTQQGEVAIQPDSITDEMLYSQIVTNKDLRQNITLFLRARGYVNDDDLQRQAPIDPASSINKFQGARRGQLPAI